MNQIMCHISHWNNLDLKHLQTFWHAFSSIFWHQGTFFFLLGFVMWSPKQWSCQDLFTAVVAKDYGIWRPPTFFLSSDRGGWSPRIHSMNSLVKVAIDHIMYRYNFYIYTFLLYNIRTKSKHLNMKQMLFSIAWPIYFGQFTLICFLQILQLDSVVLCWGRSVCNFHSGPLAILNFPVTLPGISILWFCENKHWQSQNHQLLFSNFPWHKCACSTIITKKSQDQPSVQTQVFRWFVAFVSFLSPTSPHERYGSFNRSINNWQRSIYPIMTSQRLGKIDNLGVGSGPHPQFMSILGYPSPNATWNPRKIRPQKKGVINNHFHLIIP